MEAWRSLLLLGFLIGTARAATIVSFDGGADSPYTLQQFGANPAPSVQASGGNPGGYLRLTVTIGTQNNFVPVDQTDPGLFRQSTFAFDFRIDSIVNGGADGISFSYLDTSIYGTSGGLAGAIFTPEDPATSGVLGFGFDTYGNAAPNDYTDPNTGAEFGPNYSEISVFSNGSLVARVDDTRALPTPFTLKDLAWHHATGVVDFGTGNQDGKISLSVDNIPVFSDVAVPDLVPFESRVLFAGRTGGAYERASIDNLNVLYGIPEPASGGLLAFGGLLLRCRRRS